MARTHGRIYSSAWSDDDWRALTADAQWLYGQLVSQRDLTAAGVVPLSERRWAKSAADMTPARITAALTALERDRFVVVDEDSEEILIRSFARLETQWANGKRVEALISAIGAIHSKVLVTALADELRRLDDLPARLVERLPERLAERSPVPENALFRRLPSVVTEVLNDVDGIRETGDGIRESAVATRPAPRQRGTRLPEEFELTSEMKAWALTEGHSPPFVLAATAKFVDYWRSVPGQKGVKLDWAGTWRNWVRTEAERAPARAGPVGRQAESDQMFARQLARAEAREAQ